MIRILLADDHNLVRSGLKILLDQVENFKVVGEAENGEEVIQLLKETHPDIVLLDINMPEKNGYETLKAIRGHDSTIKIMMLTMYSDQDFLVKAIELGANGYVLKKAPEEELIFAIKKIMREGSYVDNSLAQTFVHAMVNKTKTPKREIKEKNELTKREKEVLQLVVNGATDKEVADKLVISVKTVEAHKYNIKEKLQVRRLADLIRYSIDNELLDN
ncbi:hypothetical protein BHU72_07325 [Desulfuribacillus stibiiarsenatis]|uniref:DNA-binding response regulator n=1 Tax=Desulfuribacillus stibiiarsenatis TaxID=1390249 RepID=A0A1E5L4Q3_9FIRM|nr:response regulator transcription factor [Desulfuribacillus stibiiarsenatis]OEH84993.1 hypothetical protein BHU72_07325 [Desulfuribacillus stibiiarsenatis]